ncbi:MAG: metallophosphoesterase, partial [Alphaproteobacteria bacterium]|nr:metallophosphoesterase [Alphaproteobacteria bacterium]
MNAISPPAPTPIPISAPCPASAVSGKSPSSGCSSRGLAARLAAMKKRALLVLLSLLPLPAQAADSAWVQATAHGFEARLVTAEASCPTLHTATGDSVMTVRAPANANFPLVCVAPLPGGTTSATVAGITLPVPSADPQRILVLGDTGCRIKGAALQACNDPGQWPFPQLAAAAARLKPDLVIHVGDYLYRESACPPGNAGCAGSPWGDNWITWLADFYTPAAPLLAAAPIVLARGNHED